MSYPYYTITCTHCDHKELYFFGVGNNQKYKNAALPYNDYDSEPERIDLKHLCGGQLLAVVTGRLMLPTPNIKQTQIKSSPLKIFTILISFFTKKK